MSHVPDGELTAYADGAYAAGAPDAQRIEAHLALCTNCRNRLEQAHTLSARAAEILALAAPAVLTPPFAELGSRTVPRRKRSPFPLSWAATVILALGIGWFGRDIVGSRERGPTSARLETAARTASEESEEAAGAEAVPAPAAPSANQGARAPAADAVQQSAGGAAVAEGRAEVRTAQRALATTPAEVPPPSAARAPAEADFADSGVEAGRAAGRTETELEYLTTAEAERRGIRLHAVPELEIVRVGVRGDVVTVEQKLPDGKVVTISALAMEAGQQKTGIVAEPLAVGRARRDSGERQAAAAAPAAGTATEAVVITRDGVRITLSATLHPDSLRALGAKVR